MSNEVLRSILAEMEATIWPRVGQEPPDGYDCCGCGTPAQAYEDIYDLITARMSQEDT